MVTVQLRTLRPRNLAVANCRATTAAAICGGFAGAAEGLYVFVFRNDESRPVYDNNPKRKVVIHEEGLSIKPGKFEKGFSVRLENYYDHLHRVRRRNSPVPVLAESLLSGFCLDLSGVAGTIPRPARVFERYWTEAVNAFLEANGLLAEAPIKQLKRSEWRYLRRSEWTMPTQRRFAVYLHQVCAKLSEMARVGAVPSPTSEIRVR